MATARTLTDAWQIYKAARWRHIAPRTRDGYACAWRRITRALGPKPTPAQLEHWRNGLRCSVHHANFHLRVFRAVVGLAVRSTGDPTLAPLLSVRQLPEVTPVLRCPPRDFLARARELVRSPAEVLWLELACRAGLRKGELLGLRPGDYDPAAEVLTIARQRDRACRKNGRPHTVAIAARSEVAQLWAWVVEHGAEIRPRRGWHRGVSRGGWLFPWSEKYLENFAARLRAGLPPGYLPRGTVWHGCRHWAAGELARGGGTPWEIARLLGHQDASTAARYVDQVRGRAELVGFSLTQPGGASVEGSPSLDCNRARGIETATTLAIPAEVVWRS